MGARSSRTAGALVAVLLALSLGACGAGSDSAHVVAHIGGEPLTVATLDHWATVVAGGQGADPQGSKTTALRRQALELQIARRWLIGEAAARGVSISPAEIHARIAGIVQAGFPGGTAELGEFLKTSGQTYADLEQRARAELASAKLRALAVASAAPVTEAQVAAYYAAHKPSFVLPEQRTARYENRKSRAAAEKIRREVQAGKSLTSPNEIAAHEAFMHARVPAGDSYERAVDETKPYTVSQPINIGADWFIYQVVKVVPARQQTLAEVAASIRRSLTGERQRAALASFLREFTTAWTVKTDCSGGYVVPRCRQYAGPAKAEEPLSVQ